MADDDSEAKQKLVDYLQQTQNPIITPEDESTIASNSPRNYVVNKLGLPDSWKQSDADVKRYDANLPMMMGTATTGRIADVADSAANAIRPMNLLDTTKNGNLAGKPVFDSGAQNVGTVVDQAGNSLKSSARQTVEQIKSIMQQMGKTPEEINAYLPQAWEYAKYKTSGSL